MKSFNISSRMATLAALAAATAFAAPVFAATPVPAGITATLTVTGVIQPPSCTLTLGSNGTAAFGVTLLADISDSAVGTVLKSPQKVSLTIACAGSTQVAFGAADNRASTVVPSLTANWGTDGPAAGVTGTATAFGLGASGGKNIGAYTIMANNFAVDANPVTPATVAKANGAVAPAASSGTGLALNPSDATNLLTWSSAAAAATGKSFTADLTVTPTINKSSALPSSGNVLFDGSATFSVYYL